MQLIMRPPAAKKKTIIREEAGHLGPYFLFELQLHHFKSARSDFASGSISFHARSIFAPGVLITYFNDGGGGGGVSEGFSGV